MSSNITFNGVTYAIPDEGDFTWGPDLTAYFIAIASGALQKTGGTFTLGADVDFGATYGLKSTYYKSRHANPAAAGQVRLGNLESISWRNNANTADLALASNASDALLFNSKNVLFSGLALIVNADVSAAAAIAYSKLNLATSIVNADIAAGAAIAYSKLNLATSIVNADIAAAAAIAYSKLAALTVSRLLVSSAAGVVEASAVTAVEAGYLAGATSAIQTQMNLKAPSASPTFTGTVTVPATITAPSAVVLTLPTVTSTIARLANSMVRLKAGNGHGSTSTKIRRFLTTVTNTGSAITYSDSATLGSVFTINEAGVYSITYSDLRGSLFEAALGITLNDTELTTDLFSKAQSSEILVIANSAGVGFTGSVSVTVLLAVNDVIRAHDAGLNDGGAPQCHFVITQVSK